MGFLKWPLILTAIILAGVGIVSGPAAALTVLILSILEVSLSFDNAVVNATVLKNMSQYWQNVFMTIGLLIAVVGMRLLFPILVVAIGAHLGLSDVVQLALHDPMVYAEHLRASHAILAAFGGMFLWMIFLDFLIDEEKETHWIGFIEKKLSVSGKVGSLSVIIALVCLVLISTKEPIVLVPGLMGLVTYLLVNGVGDLFNPTSKGTAVVQTGLAAFSSFLYLELLDASFSFDGAMGAFAISNNIFVIALGLGIGAMFIRSLTVHLVESNTLTEFAYLEHGAHWSIGVLAFLLGVSIFHEVPELVTGLVGVAFILASVAGSMVEKKI